MLHWGSQKLRCSVTEDVRAQRNSDDLKWKRTQLSFWSRGADTQASICQLPSSNLLLVDSDLVTTHNKWKIVSVFLFNSWEHHPRVNKWSPRDTSMHVDWGNWVCGSSSHCSHSLLCHSSAIQRLLIFSLSCLFLLLPLTYHFPRGTRRNFCHGTRRSMLILGVWCLYAIRFLGCWR